MPNKYKDIVISEILRHTINEAFTGFRCFTLHLNEAILQIIIAKTYKRNTIAMKSFDKIF